MKTFNFHNVLVAIGIVFLLGTSCSGFLDDNPEPTAYGDAMIRVYKQGDSLVFNRAFYVYSTSEMDSVTVRGKNLGETIKLDTISKKYTYAYIPELDTYVSTPPDDETYYFDITFTDQTIITVTDYLDDNYIEPVEFEKLEWDTLSNKLRLKWERVENADYNKVLLLDSEDKIVFETDMIDNYYTDISINDYSYGWNDSYSPKKDDEFKVMILSYLYEYSITAFDVQCLSINDQNSFTWGVFDNQSE
ncbi:MAG: hypothetical protein PF436_10930 [Prolixibacteraceae bacterium]|jgi:hypothetical protein|nr:hypothetical protein [Prolixibacteraceae bacterium]